MGAVRQQVTPEPAALVLNVDDQESLRYARTSVLRQAGFEVREADRGEDALRLAAETLPDLILLDVNLPDISGLEVCRRLKANQRTASVPVLQIAAAYHDSESRVRSLEIGADACLAEPVEPSILIATARALVRTHRLTERLERALGELEHRLAEMARLHVQADAAAQRFERLQAITAALSEANSVEEALDTIVTRAIPAAGAAAGAVTLLSADARNFVSVRTHGYARDYVEKFRVLPASGSFPMADAIRTGAPVLISDARERQHRYPELPRAPFEGALAALPLICRGRNIGALELRFQGGRRFTRSDREFLINTAGQCAAALERARLHDSERRLLAQQAAVRKKMQELAVENARRVREADAGRRNLEQPVEQVRLQSELFDLSLDAIVICDAGRRIVSWNTAAELLYGWTAEEAAGKTVDELLGTRRSQHVDEELLARRWQGELDHCRKDGSHVAVESRQVVVRNAAGQPAAFLEINRDLTERRRGEEAVRNAQKLENVGLLAGGIAHDFNNLLTGIIGNASLLRDSVAEHDRPLLEAVIQAGQRASDLSHQLLAYAGKGQSAPARADVAQLIDGSKRLVESGLPTHAEIVCELPPSLPEIEAGPEHLRQLVVNLITNAVEAVERKEGGRVCVRAGCHSLEQPPSNAHVLAAPFSPGTYVWIEVTDNGAGIAPGLLDRIFDPFFTTKFFGRGLGLSAVQGIVRSLHGLIEIQSLPGQGSTFRVYLPAQTAASAG